MNKIEIPLILQKMNKIFAENDFEAFLVGGAVRDLVLGKPATDWDVATNAKPEQVVNIFRKVIPTGIAHGTVTVLFMGESIEVTTYRIETDYSDGRHPNSVSYASKIEEDLSRRDFTMNAIAANLANGEIVDPFDGQGDISRKLIKTVGEPLERFSEDGLRPIRAIRFASQLDFIIEEKTFDSIPKTLSVTKNISIERFRDEFVKILKSRTPSKGLRLLEQTGILEHFIPELAACRNVLQADARGFHSFDVLDHNYYTLDGAVIASDYSASVELRLASLFHDIGKPAAKIVEKRAFQIDGKEQILDVNTFHQHEVQSVKIAKRVLTNLRFQTETIKYVCHLIENHMFHYESTWSDSSIRRFIVRISFAPYDFDTVLNDMFCLRKGDGYGKDANEDVFTSGKCVNNLSELNSRIQAELAKQNAFSLKDLAISGKDLIMLGIKPGKLLGEILNSLFEAVLEQPSLNEKGKLLDLAKNYITNNL